ncbi:Cysteine/Histidine-rich C1 domain family protein [Arabidopsis thaliana]|nr:Cysteine/Histidine-rich C1 domain family protein [Arabidopsis thaliana]AEE77078.1 Cysteine/Histidine-rich C1 domain family protein [Arabidopsis thaliana]|eukprot:NP_189214.1 Cysteine/Histidine-rich C1 domain family protein [Arabidopsis thaliana]
MTEKKFPFHDHPLAYEKLDRFSCILCKKKGGFGYFCDKCYFWGHKECIKRSLLHPSPCKHSLKIYTLEALGYAGDHCHFCRDYLLDDFFHCLICNINMDLKCLKDPPPSSIYHPKNHMHMLTLLPRVVTFTCNACSVEGKRNPYVCLECNLMFHKDCIYLPRVISINCHDHRISRIFHLGLGDWKCGICRQKISCSHGAFTCLRCPSLAFHLKCAMKDDVWDGKEFEAEPKEELEDELEDDSEKEIEDDSSEEEIEEP